MLSKIAQKFSIYNVIARNGVSVFWYNGFMRKTKAKKVSMGVVMNDPRYRGYHVIVVAGKVFKARTGEGASKIFDMVRKKFPKEIPEYTYLPDADSLIL